MELKKVWKDKKKRFFSVFGAAKLVKIFNLSSFFSFFLRFSYLCKQISSKKAMKQRAQSLLFFFSALVMGVLFFMPMVSYLDEYGTYYKLFVYGINTVSLAQGVELPFSSIYALPLLVLTVAIILISFYLSMSIFRAVKLEQFVKLFKLSRINVALLVVLIATIFVYYLMKTGAPIAAFPSFQWPAFGAFLPLVALVMVLLASSGLRKDIKKVRSIDRIR